MNALPQGAVSVIFTGLPPVAAGRFRSQIDFWISKSGIEWTNKRLKAYWTAAIQLTAGNLDIVKTIYQEHSIAYDHKTMLPKGVYGPIVSGYVSAKKPAVMRKYAALLRVYTSLRLDCLSKAQKEKAKRSITSPCSGKPEDFCSHFFDYGAYIARDKRISGIKRSANLDRIDLSKLSPSSSTHKSGELLFSNPLTEFSWGKHVCSLWTSVWIPDSLKAINPAEKLRLILEQSGANNTEAGHIAFLQEGGCKARVVAVPNVWIQLLMQPFGSMLDKISRLLPEVVVHDQNRGAYWAQQELLNGHALYCHDLSAATDRFPLSLQRAFVSGLGFPQYAEALEEISKAPWISQGETWSYSVGQPMGMYSSFPLFNLSHYVLLNLLRSEVRKTCGEDCDFRVLGDDVIIKGKLLSDTYANVLQHIGCERSLAKCIEGDLTAEFAGFQIRKTNRCVTSFRPFKYSGNGRGSILNLFNAFGTKGYYPAKWMREESKLFQATRGWRNPDLSPLINYSEDDSVPKVNLNSHRLGSMSNILTYSLRYDLSSDLLDCYEEQQIILLGQKEVVKDGFASAEANVHWSPGSNPDAVLESENTPNTDRQDISSDPIMNQSRSNSETSRKMNLFS